METKARIVRSTAGATKFKVPIGSYIVVHHRKAGHREVHVVPKSGVGILHGSGPVSQDKSNDFIDKVLDDNEHMGNVHHVIDAHEYIVSHEGDVSRDAGMGKNKFVPIGTIGSNRAGKITAKPTGTARATGAFDSIKDALEHLKDKHEESIAPAPKKVPAKVPTPEVPAKPPVVAKPKQPAKRTAPAQRMAREEEGLDRPSKGKTVYEFTHPDGTKFTRESARPYTHAVMTTSTTATEVEMAEPHVGAPGMFSVHSREDLANREASKYHERGWHVHIVQPSRMRHYDDETTTMLNPGQPKSVMVSDARIKQMTEERQAAKAQREDREKKRQAIYDEVAKTGKVKRAPVEDHETMSSMFYAIHEHGDQHYIRSTGDETGRHVYRNVKPVMVEGIPITPQQGDRMWSVHRDLTHSYAKGEKNKAALAKMDWPKYYATMVEQVAKADERRRLERERWNR